MSDNTQKFSLDIQTGNPTTHDPPDLQDEITVAHPDFVTDVATFESDPNSLSPSKATAPAAVEMPKVFRIFWEKMARWETFAMDTKGIDELATALANSWDGFLDKHSDEDHLIVLLIIMLTRISASPKPQALVKKLYYFEYPSYVIVGNLELADLFARASSCAKIVNPKGHEIAAWNRFKPTLEDNVKKQNVEAETAKGPPRGIMRLFK